MISKYTLGKGVKVIKQDINGLIALFKPPGILSHPNVNKIIKTSNYKKQTLSHNLILGDYNYQDEYYTITDCNSEVSIINEDKDTNRIIDLNDNKIWLLNRLDIATSGIILVATNSLVANAVKDQFRLRNVYKQYVSIVFDKQNENYNKSNRSLSYMNHNQIPTTSFLWKDKLLINKTNDFIRIQSADNINTINNNMMDIKQAITNAILINKHKNHNILFNNKAYHTKSIPQMKLMYLEPSTGYSHQLRYQCAKHSYPIIGDEIYGDFKCNRILIKALKDTIPKNHVEVGKEKQILKRLFLHAYKIDLSYKYLDKIHKFQVTSPIPDLFYNVLECK